MYFRMNLWIIKFSLWLRVHGGGPRIGSFKSSHTSSQARQCPHEEPNCGQSLSGTSTDIKDMMCIRYVVAHLTWHGLRRGRNSFNRRVSF